MILLETMMTLGYELLKAVMVATQRQSCQIPHTLYRLGLRHVLYFGSLVSFAGPPLQ